MLARGETVILSLSTGDASLGAAVGLVDSNGGTRELQTNERLIITDMNAIAACCSQPLLVFQSSTLLANPILAIAAPGSWRTSYEGIPCPHYSYPWVVAAKAGVVILTGTGYIIQDGGWINTPPWVARAPLT